MIDQKSSNVLNESWHKAWSKWNPKTRLDLRRADKAFKAGYLAAVQDFNDVVSCVSDQNNEASLSKPLTILR